MLVAAVSACAQGPCPAVPVQTVTSSKMPVDVCIPDGYTPVPMSFFDDFSWRAFVAMVWPAAPGKRGVADNAKGVGAPGPRVFETYKSLWEIFHPDGSAPNPDFQQYEAGVNNACKITPKFGELVLASFSGIDDIGQAGNGELLGPLVGQNGKYVRTLTLYDAALFKDIVGKKYYLRSSLPPVPSPRPDLPVVSFPTGSVSLKAAWIEMAGLPDAIRKRYYTRTAFVKNVNTGECSREVVGLAGLHIAVKTPGRPQWIWSSFEQIDSVPPARPGAPGSFVFHSGAKDAKVPTENPLSLVPLAKEPVAPFNVVRTTPIHPKTVLTSYQYQELLAGTVWKNYQLVVTQWSRLDGNQATPVPATLNGSVVNTFPGTGAFSAFANLTMETFQQDRVQSGCMSCHNQARMTVDFLWSVQDHAFPPKFFPAESAAR